MLTTHENEVPPNALEEGEDARSSAGPWDAWLPRWLGPAVVAVTFAALAAWSWRKWPDVQIDFGNQLYLPWQLTLGKALYRDIEYKEGPLSIYANAALFELFGTSLRTLIWANVALFAGLTALIYALFARACGRFVATVCCLVLLVVFGFSQYVDIGNYNYVTPYTQEQTHGLILGIVAIACLGRYLERRRLCWAAAAGVSLGLVFLTKAELFVAAVAAVGVGLALGALAAPLPRRDTARAAATLVAGMLVPPAIGFGLLAATMPAGLAARGVAGNWAARLGSGILDTPFYLTGLGLDDVAGNLGAMGIASAAVAAIAAAAVAVDRLIARATGEARVVAPALAVGATVTAAAIAASDAIPWYRVGSALPAATALGSLAAIALVLRGRSTAAAVRFAPLAMWAVFAFALLGKMILAARIWHYGFTLAMPGTLLLVACLVWLIPAWLHERGGSGLFAQALVLGPIVACAVSFFSWSNQYYERKDFAVGSGGDTFFAENSVYDPRAAVITEATAALQNLMPSGATLLVLPEGTIMNYLLRCSNPSRHTLFIPTALAFFGGEAKMLEDLRAHPPDFIALVDRDTREFGVGRFGVDPRNGRSIADWVRRDYTLLRQLESKPFQGHRFGVTLLRRAAPEGSAHGAR